MMWSWAKRGTVSMVQGFNFSFALTCRPAGPATFHGSCLLRCCRTIDPSLLDSWGWSLHPPVRFRSASPVRVHESLHLLMPSGNYTFDHR